MDLTNKFKGLETATGIQMWQDICEDEDAAIYITYVYQDERTILRANNTPQIDMCEVYVNLYAPKQYDYFITKDALRDYLEENGFTVTSINTHIETYRTVKVRRVTFDCRYSEGRKKGKQEG
jgi:hypothetical protein